MQEKTMNLENNEEGRGDFNYIIVSKRLSKKKWHYIIMVVNAKQTGSARLAWW